MLHTITTLTEEIVRLLKDDPVRPEIPADRRVNSNSRIYMLKDGDRTQAITCVKFLETVPAAVEDLVDTVNAATTAVFYTIWSYTAGAGRDLIVEAQRSIEAEFPGIQTYVTLSPKTEMARRFHLKNGASIFRENTEDIYAGIEFAAGTDESAKVLDFLAKEFPDSKIYGTDISKIAIQYAKENNHDELHKGLLVVFHSEFSKYLRQNNGWL